MDRLEMSIHFAGHRNEHQHGCFERHRQPTNVNLVTAAIDITTK